MRAARQMPVSGRATRLVLSSLLLLAIVGGSAVLPMPVAAVPPVVTLQSTNSGQSLACSDPSCSTGATVVAGADTLVTLYIALAGQTGSVNVFATSATCLGTTMTQLANFTISGTSAFSRVYLFYAVGFGAGSVTCGITTSGASNNVWIWAVQAWSNVLQTAPIAQHAQATGTTQTNYTASVTNTPGSADLMVDWNVAMAGTITTPSAGAGQTQKWAKTIAAAIYAQGSTKPVIGVIPKTMYYTVTSPNAAWGQYVVDIAGISPITDTFTFTVSGLTAYFTALLSGGTGAPWNYTWAFGDGQAAYTATPSHTYGVAGTYTVYLNVTDSGGNSATTNAAVTVPVGGSTTSPPPPSNLPPNVVQYPNLINLNCNVVDFNDPRGDAAVSSTVLWAYNFGDGSAIDYSPVPGVTHTYQIPGVYDATMTVQDRQGNVQTYGISVDTTPTGCAGAVVRGVFPPTFIGLFAALMVASVIAGKKYPKWRRRLRRGAVLSFAVAIGVVILL